MLVRLRHYRYIFIMSDLGRKRRPLAHWHGVQPVLHYVYHGAVPEHGRQGWFTPPWYSCWLVRRGSAAVRFPDGTRLQARTGEWLLLPPTIRRYQSITNETEMLSLAFDIAWPSGDAHPDLPRLVPRPRSQELETTAMAVVRAATGSTYTRQRVAQAYSLEEWLTLTGHTARFVAAWLQAVAAVGTTAAEQPMDQRIRTASRMLAASARMGPVPYDDLRRATGLGRVQLDRLFVHHLGHSPRAERDRALLQQVLHDLIDPSLAIAAIAQRHGFTDGSHLSRWFRRHLGTSPRAWRQGGGEPAGA